MEGVLALLIPIIALTIPIVAIWTRHKQKIAAMQVDATAADTAKRAAHHIARIQQLEDRVRVLERIVTDKGFDLASQIEALRDPRKVETAEQHMTGQSS